jgi:hypothetical protein
MVERCPRCGLPFDREPGWVLGAMTINTAWTFLAMLATMLAGFVLTYPDIPTFWVALAAGTAAVVTPLLGYPFSKTAWIALDLAMVPARATELRIEFLLDVPLLEGGESDDAGAPGMPRDGLATGSTDHTAPAPRDPGPR